MRDVTEKIKAAVVEAFFTEAISAPEIAFHFGLPQSAVVEILQGEQSSQHRTSFSTKFKRKVAEFAHRNKDNTMSNIARYFYMKDDRRIREWVVEFPTIPREDPQHSLLESNPEIWKKRYEDLLVKHNKLVKSVNALRNASSCMYHAFNDLSKDIGAQ